VESLVDTHRSGAFDHTAMARDPNLALPIERMRELRARGRIGTLNARHLSFAGSAPGRVVHDTGEGT
jgi:D-proline reductase (dithiol) PrdB